MGVSWRRGPTAVVATLFLLLSGARPSVQAEPRLQDLDSVEAFAQRFDAAVGKPRLVLLLSPT